MLHEGTPAAYSRFVTASGDTNPFTLVVSSVSYLQMKKQKTSCFYIEFYLHVPHLCLLTRSQMWLQSVLVLPCFCKSGSSLGQPRSLKEMHRWITFMNHKWNKCFIICMGSYSSFSVKRPTGHRLRGHSLCVNWLLVFLVESHRAQLKHAKIERRKIIPP